MAVTAASFIRNDDVVLVGTGLPMIAAFLAKAVHAPNSILVFESGVIDARPTELATGVGDFRLVASATCHRSLDYALSLLQGGKVTLGFLGGAEIDPRGNINSTAIGDYWKPTTRLGGSGGANDIASMAKRFVIIARHDRRRFPERLAYLTSPGNLEGPGSRESHGLPGKGPEALVTDLGSFIFNSATGSIELKSVHPGVTIDEIQQATGFAVTLPEVIRHTEVPDDDLLDLLRTTIDPTGFYIGD